MIPAWAFVATCLLILTGGLAAMRHTTRTIADDPELIRLTGWVALARDDLTDGPWRGGSPYLHYVGRPIATHRSDETATATPGYIPRHHELGMAVLVRALMAPTEEFHAIVSAAYGPESLIHIGRPPEIARAA